MSGTPDATASSGALVFAPKMTAVRSFARARTIDLGTTDGSSLRAPCGTRGNSATSCRGLTAPARPVHDRDRTSPARSRSPTPSIPKTTAPAAASYRQQPRRRHRRLPARFADPSWGSFAGRVANAEPGGILPVSAAIATGSGREIRPRREHRRLGRTRDRHGRARRRPRPQRAPTSRTATARPRPSPWTGTPTTWRRRAPPLRASSR